MALPVICIPRINSNVTKHHIYDIFGRLGWGTIENVYIANSSKNKTCCVFIYLKWNNNRPDIQDICNKLTSGLSIKLVYKDYTIWKLYAKK